MDVDRNAPAVGKAETEIAAPPGTVWALVSGIDGWPTWNPDVQSVHLEGELAPGSTFRWKSGPGTITSTLRHVDPPHEIGWTGKTLGIQAVHVYRLVETEGGTRVVSEESWRGLPVRLARKGMGARLQAALENGLEHLKTEAERTSP